jgi:hypothetical protein
VMVEILVQSEQAVGVAVVDLDLDLEIESEQIHILTWC